MFKLQSLPVSKYSLPPADVPFVAGGGEKLAKLGWLHTHPGIEFGIATESDGLLNLNGREYPMRTGDFFFVDAMIPHWHYGAPGDNFRIFWVSMPFSAALSLVPGKSDARFIVPFTALRKGLSPVIFQSKSLYKSMLIVRDRYRAKDQDWDLFCWREIVSIMHEIYFVNRKSIAGLGADIPSGTQVTTLLPALHCLDREFAGSIGVTELARLCCLSPSRFAHLFAEIIGISPIQYRNRLRIASAIELLTNTNDGLLKISADCGFQNLSQFRAVFQKFTGKTPGTFRKSAMDITRPRPSFNARHSV